MHLFRMKVDLMICYNRNKYIYFFLLFLTNEVIYLQRKLNNYIKVIIKQILFFLHWLLRIKKDKYIKILKSIVLETENFCLREHFV